MALAEKVDVKVVLLGKEYGGKTSLVERFLNDRFSDSIPYQNTIGAAFGAKKVEVRGGETVTLGIWDTAGSERYQAMSRMYYRGAAAAVVCINLTEADSFHRAKFWVNELRTCEGNGVKIYLVGTKYDLVQGNKSAREVDAGDIQAFADEVDGSVWDTSAKTGHNVEKLFADVAAACQPTTSRTGLSASENGSNSNAVSIHLHNKSQSMQSSGSGRCKC